MADNQFMRGTMILLVTSVILKIMGFFYQIVTIRLILSLIHISLQYVNRNLHLMFQL